MDIKTFNDIDLDTDEGKLLFMAIARLTCLTDTDKTPDMVIEKLVELDHELRN